ncbi:hypothetical protein ACFE04_010352 [Oxalis oulophora]
MSLSPAKTMSSLYNHAEPKQSKPRNDIHYRWHAASPRSIKINFDASFISGSHSNIFGGVIRDDSGQVIAAAAGLVGQADTGYHAEALALFDAMKIAKEFNLANDVFEGDCLNLISDLNSQHIRKQKEDEKAKSAMTRFEQRRFSYL